MQHLHLDLVGGLSGDMFISGMLDAFPAYGADLEHVIEQAGFPELVTLNQEPFDDGTLTGTRFTVSAKAEEGHHHHRHYSEIRTKLESSVLSDATKSAALEMFRLVAEVEAAIHGKSVESVAFHEVGAWDSIADIVLAAHLIAQADASWSVSAIPAGSGFVETAHGRLPVPAPATARLLEGFELYDDGINGERVTPTGAAILRFLSPSRRLPAGHMLRGTGYGFGTKKFPGISNVVRVCAYEAAAVDLPWKTDEVTRLSFDIDDQTPEQLAQSLELLRAEEGVIDVMQQASWGKKSRLGFTVSVLVSPHQFDAVTTRCFDLTTTLGIRREAVSRMILQREEVIVYVDEHPYRVKVARRPGGLTAKVEMDDLVAMGLTLVEQEIVRSKAEAQAIQQASL